MKEKPKNPAAVALGHMTSPKKAAASRRNGRLGGRPVSKAKTVALRPAGRQKDIERRIRKAKNVGSGTGQAGDAGF